jgi:geranylgeranyl diphosphate synthase type I
MTAAAAVELIHNFSLIHDDIEDRSRLRRGRRTVWDIWGEPQAINAGDTLFIVARNALLKLADQGVPLPTVLEAIDRLDQTCLALCRGQYLDMGFETAESVDLTAYLDMIEGKTANLLACAGYLGGLIATNEPAKAQPFWELGIAAGLAFQIQDDWLGIWGDEAVTGKVAADDLRRRKKTLPVVYVLNQDNHQAAEYFRKLYAAPELSEADVTEAIEIMEEVGAKAYTEDKAREQIDRAEQLLNGIEAHPDQRETLQELARYFIQRVY